MQLSARLAFILNVLAHVAGRFAREHRSGGELPGMLASHEDDRVNQEMHRTSHVLLPVVVNKHGSVLPSTPLKRCALVGSSQHLIGRHHGADIESHDTVIRINRLPVSGFFDDFGTRTDVLFSNRGGAEVGIPVMGGSMKHGVDCRKGGPGCTFGSIVFKKFSKHLQGWLDAPFTIGAAHSDVWHTAMSLLRHEHTPSTGFMAFVTYLALCDELQLYGFVGNATADGHKVEKKHAYDLEHAIMRRISLGRSARTTWAQSIDNRSPDAIQWFEDHVGKNVSVEVLA